MRIENLKGIVDIDGSYGSGGGQILRTALALSILTKKPFKLRNIRAKRKNPGLAAQHLACVKVAQQLSDAYVQNAMLGSQEILFVPKGVIVKDLSIDIGTAGSISLVLQTLMPCLIEQQSFKAEIIGGTDVSNAPPIDYIKYVLLPLLNKIGYEAEITIERRGFYPKGGGKVTFVKKPGKLKFYEFIERGKLIEIRGNVVVSSSLSQAKIAEKIKTFTMQWLKAEAIFKPLPINISLEYVDSYSPGAVLTLWLITQHSVLGASAIGERGKPSEVVAKEASVALSSELSGSVDSHAADQLLPFLAYLCDKTKKQISLKTSFITDHTRTNAFVIEKFLPLSVKIDEKKALISLSPQKYEKNLM
ncbi:MAG: RNA 3'-terminal phosphate cyclase [Candidatus Pacearchaeota archaeon]